MKLSKGIELPMNTLVVIAIAIIVLLGMTALFVKVFHHEHKEIPAQVEFNSLCKKWAQIGCTETNTELLNNVFEAYKNWTNTYKDCTSIDDTAHGCNKDEVLKTLRQACQCE